MATIYLYPNSNLPLQQLTGSGYQDIDEPYNSPDDASSYLRATAHQVASFSDFTLQNISYSYATITKVTVYIRTRGSYAGVYYGAYRGGIYLYNDSDKNSSDHSIPWVQTTSKSWTTRYKEYSTNPFTGNAWTISEINDLVVQCYGWFEYDDESNYTQTQITQIYIKVEGTFVDEPTVTTTTPPSAKDHESATVGGNVTDDGDGNITERGFEYKEGSEGEVSTESEEDTDFGEDTFSLEVTGLKPNTLYYYRAYAVNPSGTGYGDWESFTTDSTTPIVTYDSVSNQTATGFTLNGTITEDGGITCSIRGFDVGLTKDVYTSYTDSGNYEEGSFSKAITGLAANTTYFVRAKVTNANGSYNSAWTAVTTAAAGSIPTNKRLNIVTDYGGYGYNVNQATTDDGETYTAYFEFTTDLLQDQLGIMLFKRLLEVWLFINSQSSGSITLYVKEDTESSWQTAGTYSMIDSNQVITRVHLPVDYRAIIYQFKLESSSYFEFLGLVGGYRKDGFR